MYRMIVAILSLYFLCSSTMCRAFEVEDCGSTVGKFTSITLDCDMSKSQCELIQNTNVTIVMDFTIDKEVSKVTAVVHGIVMDVPIPFPLSNADACADPASGLKCPLVKGGPYQYKNTLAVHKYYPKLSVTVKWEMKDQDNETIICMLIPAKIK